MLEDTKKGEPPNKPPRSPNDATPSAPFHFFHALFWSQPLCFFLIASLGKPTPFHVLWNVFPFAHCQNLSNNRGHSRREWGIVWLLLVPKIQMRHSEFLLVNLPLTLTFTYSESKSK